MINEDVAMRLTYVWNNGCVKCFTGFTVRPDMTVRGEKLALSHIIMRKQ